MIGTWHSRGTLRGDFMGYAPTGRSISVPAVSVFHFREGKLSGERVFFDMATLFRQAGLRLVTEEARVA
jgi:predicted ester cyclase